jgi:glycosyltransferase involved in cell wall biosynthesis
MTSVNVIAFENGVGNSRDLALVARTLAALGCEVTVTSVGAQVRRRRRSQVMGAVAALRLWFSRRRQRLGTRARFDVNLMMEHVWPEALHLAACNIVVPNPEWFDRRDRGLLACVDRVWSKTGHSLAAFRDLGCRTTLIGFDSEDRYEAAVPREPSFFHLAGKSRMKGTARLVRLWARHSEWPRLTVVHSRKAVFEAVAAPNIAYETRYLTDAELRQLQNRHLFHLCLSETEGWGHYIPEALSVGAVVLATDAPPMNEHVTPDRGLLVACTPHGRQHLATTYAFDAAALERGVEAALALDGPGRARLGRAARAWFLDNQRGFPERVARALAEAPLARGEAPAS